MHSARDLLDLLQRRGVRIWTEEGQIRFRACKGELLPEDRNQLRLLKAEMVELLEQVQLDSEYPLGQRSAGCLVPLTPVQSQMWNYYREAGELSRRTCVTSMRILGPLDISFLQSSIEFVVQRHESLRTRFVIHAGLPTQHIGETCGDRLEVFDMSDIPSANTEDHVQRLSEEFVQEKIDLSVGPLFAAKLFRLSSHEHVLTFALDHMIADGISKAILASETWTLYGQADRGVPFSLPRLSVQFADYAVWQYRTYAAWLIKHERYLKHHLSGVPHIQLPIHGPVITGENPLGMRQQIMFGSALSIGLREVARREQSLLAIVVLTIYVAVLSRWCHQRDFLLGFATNGRNRPQLTNMVGCLAECLYLRIEIAIEDCLLELLNRVKSEFYAACDHQCCNRVPDFIPECSGEIIGFNWQSPNLAFVELQCVDSGKVRLEPFPFFRKAIPARFASFFFDSAAGITWSIEYRADLFTVEVIERFGHSLLSFAGELIRRPLTRIASIPISF